MIRLRLTTRSLFGRRVALTIDDITYIRHIDKQLCSAPTEPLHRAWAELVFRLYI